MSESVTANPHRARKTSEFPYRLSHCFAPDQMETLAAARKMFRATDSYLLRAAWDLFCRQNQIVPPNNGGTNGK